MNGFMQILGSKRPHVRVGKQLNYKFIEHLR